MELTQFDMPIAGGAKRRNRKSQPLSTSLDYKVLTKTTTRKTHKTSPTRKTLVVRTSVHKVRPAVQTHGLAYRALTGIRSGIKSMSTSSVKAVNDLIGYKNYKKVTVVKKVVKKAPAKKLVHIKSHNKHSPKSPGKKKDVHVKPYNRHQAVKKPVKRRVVAKKVRKVIGYSR